MSAHARHVALAVIVALALLVLGTVAATPIQ